jgi:hypothetical protein
LPVPSVTRLVLPRLSGVNQRPLRLMACPPAPNSTGTVVAPLISLTQRLPSSRKVVLTPFTVWAARWLFGS